MYDPSPFPLPYNTLVDCDWNYFIAFSLLTLLFALLFLNVSWDMQRFFCMYQAHSYSLVIVLMNFFQVVEEFALYL